MRRRPGSRSHARPAPANIAAGELQSPACDKGTGTEFQSSFRKNPASGRSFGRPADQPARLDNTIRAKGGGKEIIIVELCLHSGLPAIIEESTLAFARPSRPMAAPDGGPDPASKYFTHCPQWQLVFCKTCEHAVWPDKIASHLQNKTLGHQIKPGVAQAVQAAVQQWPDLIYRATDLAAVPDPPMPAIFGLKIHTNGFRCQIKPGECQFVCLKHETIKSHLSKVHPGSRGRKGTRSLAARDQPAPELYKGI
ncbi:hypothetical protein MMC34_005684, partial [Xylographa carneopallida]|nr:hypothetical protein [Xylographa carneopallida]